MLDSLDRTERLSLMKFVCSFAWADLKILPEERQFIADLVRRLELDGDEGAKVVSWLEVPPRPEEVDPTAIPAGHRRLFFDSIVGIIEADGVISEEERDSLALFEGLLT